jgi:hypothetical protein
MQTLGAELVRDGIVVESGADRARRDLSSHGRGRHHEDLGKVASALNMFVVPRSTRQFGALVREANMAKTEVPTEAT